MLFLYFLDGCILDGWKYIWEDEWMVGWVDDVWVDGWMDGCVGG